MLAFAYRPLSRLPLALVLPLLFVTWGAGCGQRPADGQEDGSSSARVGDDDPPRLPSVLVPMEWLDANLEQPDLVLLDARPLEDYLAGHLPGAISLDYEETYAEDPERRYDLAPIGEVSAVFGNRGLDMGETVVIYGDDEDFKPSCRLFWALEVMGHPSVGVLNGGPATWVAEGGVLETDERVSVPTLFVPEPNTERLATKDEVVLAMREGRKVLVDSRPRAHYLGQAGWESQPRWGHIPNAINLDPTDCKLNRGETALFGSAEELPSIYHELAAKEVITYCNAGHEATISYMLLRSLGGQVAVYDGSWCEWSTDRTLPAENESLRSGSGLATSDS